MGKNVCDNFSGDANEVCKRLNKLGSWLSDYKGLNMRKIIDDKLSSLQSPVPEDKKESYINALKLIYSTGKYNRDEIIAAKNKIDNSRLVFSDGEWHFVNKLNTNYSDLSELLTELFVRGNVIQKLKNTPNIQDYLLSIKDSLSKLLDKYFLNAEEYKNFINNTQLNSSVGEESEQKIEDFLESNGFKIEYRGGNGDFIDMIFGADIIARHPKFGLKLIQVKYSGPYWESLSKYNVDWIGIGKDLQIYDAKTKQNITQTIIDEKQIDSVIENFLNTGILLEDNLGDLFGDKLNGYNSNIIKQKQNFYSNLLEKYSGIKDVMKNFEMRYNFYVNTLKDKIEYEKISQIWELIFKLIDKINNIKLYKLVGKDPLKVYDIKKTVKKGVESIQATKVSQGNLNGFTNKLITMILYYLEKGNIDIVIRDITDVIFFIDKNVYDNEELKKYLLEIIGNYKNYDNILEVFTQFKKLEWVDYEKEFVKKQDSIFKKYTTRQTLGDKTIGDFKRLLDTINDEVDIIIRNDEKQGLNTPEDPFYVRNSDKIKTVLEKYRNDVNILIEEIYGEIIKNQSFEKADLILTKNLTFNNKIVINSGNIEVKKLPPQKDSYLSEFYSYGKDEFYAELLKSKRIINSIYNFVIQKVFEKLENTQIIIDNLKNNLKGIIFEDFYITPSENIQFYWSNKGMSSCNQLRLSIRFRIIDGKKVYKLNNQLDGIESSKSVNVKSDIQKCNNNKFESIDYNGLENIIISDRINESLDNYINNILNF